MELRLFKSSTGADRGGRDGNCCQWEEHHGWKEYIRAGRGHEHCQRGPYHACCAGRWCFWGARGGSHGYGDVNSQGGPGGSGGPSIAVIVEQLLAEWWAWQL